MDEDDKGGGVEGGAMFVRACGWELLPSAKAGLGRAAGQAMDEAARADVMLMAWCSVLLVMQQEKLRSGELE